MTTAYLHGNGKTCPTCNGSGSGHPEMPEHLRMLGQRCKACRGIGKKAFTDQRIASETARLARLHYWPKAMARMARSGAR